MLPAAPGRASLLESVILALGPVRARHAAEPGRTRQVLVTVAADDGSGRSLALETTPSESDMEYGLRVGSQRDLHGTAS